VSQRRTRNNIADGINTRYIRLIIGINEDFAFVGFNTKCFKSDVFDICYYTGR
jgi:hypothetical protein